MTSELSPFLRRRGERFRLPRRHGEAIASLDDPRFVAAGAAAHMRPDDVVIGLSEPRPRAYPVWIVDHYHVVNDRAGAVAFLVASCERCQSGAAFLADVPGPASRPPSFRGVGVTNACLTLTDLRTASTWNHIDGVAIAGRARGTALAFLPALQIEWRDWVALHPDTEVLVPPEDPRHPDARHGHGREEIFGRPGIDPLFVPTIEGAFDTSLPENELVLAVRAPADGPDERADEATHRWNAYPLKDVQRAGGALRDGEVVVLAGPRGDGFTMAAYRAALGDERVELERRPDGSFVDRATGSRFTIGGVCVGGPMQGRRLEPLRSSAARWHGWFYPHRDTRLRRVADDERVAPDLDDDVAAVVHSLASSGRTAEVETHLVSQLRPRGAASSVVLRVDGARMRLHVFEHLSAARDFVAFDGAWACDPFAARLGAGPCARVGAVVVQADPERRYADPAQLVPLPDEAVTWGPVAELLDDDVVPPRLRHAPPGPPAFVDLLRELRARGIEPLDPAFLPRHQLRPEVEDAIAATLEGDRFLLYRFGSEGAARRSAAELGHAVASGAFVARSSPDSMYEHREYEIGYAGDDRIGWSKLLADPRLPEAMASATRRAA